MKEKKVTFVMRLHGNITQISVTKHQYLIYLLVG